MPATLSIVVLPKRRRAVASVVAKNPCLLSQIFPVPKLIVVDDGSEDNTVAVARETLENLETWSGSSSYQKKSR